MEATTYLYYGTTVWHSLTTHYDSGPLKDLLEGDDQEVWDILADLCDGTGVAVDSSGYVGNEMMFLSIYKTEGDHINPINVNINELIEIDYSSGHKEREESLLSILRKLGIEDPEKHVGWKVGCYIE